MSVPCSWEKSTTICILWVPTSLVKSSQSCQQVSWPQLSTDVLCTSRLAWVLCLPISSPSIVRIQHVLILFSRTAYPDLLGIWQLCTYHLHSFRRQAVGSDPDSDLDHPLHALCRFLRESGQHPHLADRVPILVLLQIWILSTHACKWHRLNNFICRTSTPTWSWSAWTRQRANISPSAILSEISTLLRPSQSLP